MKSRKNYSQVHFRHFASCLQDAARRQKNEPALPEVRNNGTAIQWKYSGETDWHDLVALDELRGAAGEAGKDGIKVLTAATKKTVSAFLP